MGLPAQLRPPPRIRLHLLPRLHQLVLIRDLRALLMLKNAALVPVEEMESVHVRRVVSTQFMNSKECNTTRVFPLAVALLPVHADV